MKKSWVSRTQRFTYFQILCYALERWTRKHNQIMHGKTSWVGSKIHHNTELWTQLMVSRWNSSGTFSQDSPHGSSSTKSKSSWTKWATQHNSMDESSSCRCSITSYGDLKTMNRNANQALNSFLYAKRFSPGRWSFLRSGSEKKWYSTHESKPQGEWDRVAELIMLKFGEIWHPVFRATSPLSRGTLKSKGGGQLSIHFCVDEGTIETVLCTIISVNQQSIYGAVSDLCDEYSACHVRTERPVLAGQSDPLFEPARLWITTPTPSTEVPVQEIFLQKYRERVERLSQQDRVTKICTDAGFLNIVEVGQYFMRKDSEDFSQFTDSVVCREYTLPRDEKSSDPKGWIQGNTKIGPVFEVTTSYLQGKYGVEIRIESVNKDNSHSWVRISHGFE